MTTRVVDGKGRLALGAAYAGRLVIVEQRDEQIIVTPAVPVPEREAWLYANPVAQAGVAKGLEQARARSFTKRPPNVSRDASVANDCAD